MSATLTHSSRIPDHKVHPVFAGRWSPRAYTGEAISDADLFTAFEAARWSPSAGNAQPWRFIYAKRDSAAWLKFFDLLAEVNKRWAVQSAALVVVISQKLRRDQSGVLQPSKFHSYDTGAAWQSFALQASLLGWSTRGIGGFDRDKARAVLNIPDDYHVEAALTIGRQADSSILPPELQEKEKPTGRLPVSELIFEGGFKAA